MRTLRNTGSALALVAALALVLASAAPAETIDAHSYDGTYPSGSFDGSDANGSGPFETIGDVEIDQSTGDLLVAGQGSAIYRLNPAGQSIPFAELAPATVLTDTNVEFLGNVDVDNSETATQGRIYAQTAFGPTTAYLPGGAHVSGESWPVPGRENNCGGAVDPQGNYWIGVFGYGLYKYTSSGEDTGTTLSLGGNDMCDFAIDAAGNFYAPQPYYGGPLNKYGPDGTFLQQIDPGPTQAVAIDPGNGDVYADDSDRVNRYDSSGTLLDTFGLDEPGKDYPGLQGSAGLAVNGTTHDVYVADNRSPSRIDVFVPTGPVTIPTVETGKADISDLDATAVVLHGSVDPDGIATTACSFDWGTSTSPYPNNVPCAQGQVLTGSGAVQVSAEITGLEKGQTYHFRLTSRNANRITGKGDDEAFIASGKPIVVNEALSKINTDGVQFNVTIDPNGDATSYRIEYGTEAGVYGTSIPVPDGQLATALDAQSFSLPVTGLTPDTTYHYRTVAANGSGVTEGPDRSFKTFPASPPDDPCENALVRKQTAAALLLDCRAYELVSAADQGGYDVESSLLAGQTPLVQPPSANGRVLYSLRYGALPGADSPTNFGHDPYVASRTADGWQTKYVGLSAEGMPSTVAFGSPLLGAAANLETFAFGGENICGPCFADGSVNVPLRLADGRLAEGMAGSENPGPAQPAGEVRAPLSADGNHFVFGSEGRFEPDGNDGSLSLYERDLAGGQTQVISKTAAGATMPGAGLAELDISADGSRVLFGRLVGTDAAGNEDFDLYMHVDGENGSVPVVETPDGVLYNGMTADGGRVFFTSADRLADDSDDSPDLFRADVSPAGATVTRVSSGSEGTGNSDSCAPAGNWNVAAGGPNCGTLSFAGGAGIAAADGTVFFLSPELLDGVANGIAGQPNLYVSRPGADPVFVATIDNSLQKPGPPPQPIDNPAIVHAVDDAATHRFGDFQVSPDGDFALFASQRSLNGAVNKGHFAIYRYSTATGTVECVSCGPSGNADVRLTESGLNLASDGRVFFTTPEQFVLRDTNEALDAYEFEDGNTQLISSGTNRIGSGLLGISEDGVDAYFFTRDTLAPQDENGSPMKIYDAREGGGFVYQAPPFPCAASDECHGPGTQAADPPVINTVAGSGKAPARRDQSAVKCKRGFHKKKGKCLKNKPGHRGKKKSRGGSR